MSHARSATAQPRGVRVPSRGTGRGGAADRGPGRLVGAHVVGVAVPAAGVVGDDDVGTDLLEHLGHGLGRHPQRHAGPGPRVGGRRRPRHPGVAEALATRPGEEVVVGDAEGGDGARRARARRWAARAGPSPSRWAHAGGMTSPSSPRVQVSTCTSSPRATWCAIATPVVRLSSSGWAWTRRRRAGRPAGDEAVEEAPHRATAMSANSTTPPRTAFAERLRTSVPAT